MMRNELIALITANSSQNMSSEACARQAERIAAAIMENNVCVPKAALEFVLENASFCDEGPSGAGWSSPEMDSAFLALNAALVQAQ